MLKKLLAVALAVIMIAALAACGKKTDEEADYSFADGDQYEYIGGTLNILNWGEYIDEELISIFEEETGVKVTYVEMTSNEEMLIKLRAADCVYDLCFPSDYIIEQLIANDLLLPLDYSKIPNAKNIQPRVMKIAEGFDPGNKYSLPYFWGTVGILYNTKLVDEPVDSWDILWNEKYAGQIWQYDSVRDAIGVSLIRLGYDINTRNPDEVNAAKDELIKQIPLLKGRGTDDIRTNMINEQAALAVIYSGDAYECCDSNNDLAYVVPKEGSNVWFDNVVIPKTAKNVEAAHAFINFINDANLAARNTEYCFYSTPNQGALDLLDEDFTSNEIFNPTDETLARCAVFHDLGDFVEVFNRAWDEYVSATGVH
ncbi:MAG: spermidine/putrescine ABC transporter substrate-binding protein [Clostridia bacterium]|jgi:spermidine/putrescine-binding protein|nr:spermidine/putrescine ABC transporter substrate-binding protein [Clostridia bacterium]